MLLSQGQFIRASMGRRYSAYPQFSLITSFAIWRLSCNSTCRRARKITYDFLSLLSSLFCFLFENIEKRKKKSGRGRQEYAYGVWPMERKRPNPTLHSLLLSFVWNPVMPGGIYHVQIKQAINSELPRASVSKRLLIFSKIQQVVYYQCCVLIG